MKMGDSSNLDKIKVNISNQLFKKEIFEYVFAYSAHRRSDDWVECKKRKAYIDPMNKLIKINKSLKQNGMDYLINETLNKHVKETIFKQNIENCHQLIALKEAALILFSNGQTFHFKKGSKIYCFSEEKRYYFKKENVIARI